MNLQGLRQVDLLGDLLPPPPLLVHALLPPQQLSHVRPACWSALLKAGWPVKDKHLILRISA